MSSSIPSTYSFLNSPLINTITSYIAQIQERKILTRERFHSLTNVISITIGFFVLLYFLIHIQILFYWFLKLIFRLIFKIISIIFWLPVRTTRFFIPKTIDYDILFPLFWLCSISSFYISKFSHENICQFYDQHLVRRYKILNYDQAKRDDIKRYLFILTFIVLLLFQSIFILIPIAASIRHHNENAKTHIIDRQTTTTTIKTSTAKLAVKEAVETMSESLYDRFIDAFKDEKEPHKNKKRQPLISDEKLEHTVKTIHKSIKNQINNLKPTNKQNETNQDNKSSRFQRWIIHYLKAPFQKWEKKKNEDVNTKIEEKNFEDENEEENIELSSSSSIISDTDETDDEDDENDNQEEYSTITEQIKQRIDTVKNFGHKLKENVKSKISSKKEEEEEEEDDDVDDNDTDEDHSPSLEEHLTKPIEAVKNIGTKIVEKFSSSTTDDDEDSGYESDDEEEKQSSKLSEKVKKTLATPIETVKNVAANIKNKIVPSTDEDDEPSPSITEQIKDHIIKPIEEKLSSLTKHNEKENVVKSFIDDKKETTENISKSIKDTISESVDKLKQTSTHVIDSAEDFVSSTLEKSSEYLKEATEQIPTSNQVRSKIKEQVVEPIENKVSQVKNVIDTKVEHLKETIDDGIKSLKRKKEPKILTEKIKDKLKSLSKITHKKLSRHEKKKKNISLIKKLKKKIKRKLNGYFDDAWNIWHQGKIKLARIFTSSTKHARHLPRYNTTSLYTAYTDLKCYDYIKHLSRYRLLKRKHLHFLDTYRHHSPFPVYLSILKSNGPRCYRQYPNSSCALIFKTSNRNFKTQLYRFVRFWAIIGIIVVILAAIYASLTDKKQTHFSLFHHQENSDRSPKNKQLIITANKNDLSRSTTAIEQKPSSSSSSFINQQTVSSNTKTYRLDQKIEKQLRLWLHNEKNDGFRHLSETYRIAINNTFLKKHVSY
ncbi:unnamed protein product [Rotaria sp. Silwood1]|nr:unnamed protein product [Rotaria sp. Silwood1]CAF4632340.1 unnamed protein product [Rotaria sp. Silwood1]